MTVIERPDRLGPPDEDDAAPTGPPGKRNVVAEIAERRRADSEGRSPDAG